MKAKPKAGKKPSATRRPQQQQHAAKGEGKQYGEGSYAGTRQYNAGLKDHVEHHDIEREARDAAPRSADEAQELEAAERIGRGRARGAKQSPDEPENQEDLVK